MLGGHWPLLITTNHYTTCTNVRTPWLPPRLWRQQCLRRGADGPAPPRLSWRLQLVSLGSCKDVDRCVEKVRAVWLVFSIRKTSPFVSFLGFAWLPKWFSCAYFWEAVPNKGKVVRYSWTLVKSTITANWQRVFCRVQIWCKQLQFYGDHPPRIPSNGQSLNRIDQTTVPIELSKRSGSRISKLQQSTATTGSPTWLLRNR